MSDLDAAARSIEAFTLVLRGWLRARHELPEVQAAAMAYETAALIAGDAETILQADTLIDAWAADMKVQVREFGVGVEHP